METINRLQHLRQFQFPETEIAAAAYKNSGTFQAPKHPLMEGLPPFHRMLLKIHSGEQGLSHTEIWLPDRWNGILLGIGNGGMAGSIAYGAFPEYLKAGYAVANSDMGTSRGERSGIQNPDVWKDFGWRATHQMTLAAKAVIRWHYGNDPDFCYFIGGSTGGQQSLVLAQRFPEDYDGIIAGVPANNRTMLHTYFLWNHVHLYRPGERTLFSQEEIIAVTDLVTSFFQERKDGCPGDQFISLPQASEQLIDKVLAYLSEKHPAFTKEQLDALQAVYTGPVNPRTGRRIYNGMPMGSEPYHCGIEQCQKRGDSNFYPFYWVFGEDYDPYSFDFDHDLDRLNDVLAEDLNANSADLSAFQAKGGKLLMYSGSADPCVPFPDAMRYYERVLENMGGYEIVKDFFRYFLMPGRDHGNTGRGTNALSSLEGKSELELLRDWKEKGIAPMSLQAIRYRNGDPKAEVEFIRTIYPYGSEHFPLGCCPPSCEQYD